MRRAQGRAVHPSREGSCSVDADRALPRPPVPAPTLEEQFGEWLPELPFAWYPDAE